jgi:hypothetical protein
MDDTVPGDEEPAKSRAVLRAGLMPPLQTLNRLEQIYRRAEATVR